MFVVANGSITLACTIVGLVVFGFKYGLRSDLTPPKFKNCWGGGGGGAAPDTPSMCVLTHAPSSVPPPQILSTFHRLCAYYTKQLTGILKWLLLYTYSPDTSAGFQGRTPTLSMSENWALFASCFSTGFMAGCLGQFHEHQQAM